MSNKIWITVRHVPTNTMFLNDEYDGESIGKFQADFRNFLDGLSGTDYFESFVTWDDNLCRVIIPTKIATELYVSTTTGER